MYIEVNKVVRPDVKSDGQVVRGKDRKPVKEDPRIEPEFIRIDEVKSFKNWRKDPKEEECIPGDMTVIFAYGDKERTGKGRPVKIYIAENVHDFATRIGAVSLKDAK